MPKDEKKLDTVVGRNTVVNGTIKAEGSIRIDGRLEGDVNVSETFVAGKDSYIKGEIRCKNAVIGGRVEGNLNCKEGVEMESGANLRGDITCKGLVIHEKAFFEGHCVMSDKKEKLVAAEEPKDVRH